MNRQLTLLLLTSALAFAACTGDIGAPPSADTPVEDDSGTPLDNSPCETGAECDSGVCIDSVCQQARCGDGVVQASNEESCDDGNNENGDGCPDGPGGSCQPAVCGDGFVLSQGDHSEACDGDGNGTAGETISCNSNCTIAACGDGIVNTSAGESCDDGNQSNSDECADGPGGSCQPSSCSDNITSGAETDTDCGGPACAPCAVGDGCVTASDCSSGVCAAGTCQLAQCGDGIINGGETDTDCGGPCAPCDAGDSCLMPSDCSSGVCSGGLCQAPSCNDGIANGGESDTDCGGPCAPCATGSSCAMASDCSSGVCSGGTCQAGQCGDGVVQAQLGESCDDGNQNNHDDCPDGLNGSCQPANCNDGFLHNQGSGAETGVDCGGPVCTACAPPSALSDDFAGSGNLLGWTLHYRNIGQSAVNPLPDITRTNGRYRANLTNNTNNQTLHYNQSEGRIDYKAVSFPFTVIARNIGVGTQANSQSVPMPPAAPNTAFIFSGLQIHVPEFYDSVTNPNLAAISSAHVVVGHRGFTTHTIEGKTTNYGNSMVNDTGQGTAPNGRADIRIVGKSDFTLEVSWQTPNPSPGIQPDNWNLYNGSGNLPGTMPNYGHPAYGGIAYVGLITYAYFTESVPFVGTCDGVEFYQP